MKGLRFIVGSGRSGTTWVQDALADANNLRPVFEPLHPAVSDIGARYAYRALAAEDPEPDLEQFFDEAAAGRKYRLWTLYRLPGGSLVPQTRHMTTLEGIKTEYRRRLRFLRERSALAAAARRPVPLIKCIRANLMLGWLSQRCGARVVLMVRHPGAVVESQFRLGRDVNWNPVPILDRYRKDARLHELTGGRYRSLLARKMSRIEALTANWVIENQWPIAHAADDGVEVVYYERLKSVPEREWRTVCRALHLANIPAAEALARPSQQSSNGSSGAKGAPKWLRALTREQIGLIQGVLDEVGFRTYDMRSAEPLASGPVPGGERQAGASR